MVIGRQLGRIPESSRGELICRAGENRKSRMGGFSGIPRPKDSKGKSGNNRDDCHTISGTFQDTPERH